MGGHWCSSRVATTLATILLWACLMVVGCGRATDAQTAVIVPVEWENVQEIRQVRYRNRPSELEIIAILEDNEEVSCTRTISWEQGDQLRHGRASLTVKSMDGRFLDAWITVVPD